jgi:4-hydroxy-tetrahydrodipicolinate reductase
MSYHRLLIHGASGRMGRSLLRLLPEFGQLQLVAVVANGDPGPVAGEVPVFRRESLAQVPAFDLAIDFSQPAGFDGILALCRSRRAALVSGTTGLQASQHEAMQLAVQEIPLLWASNFSLGVAVLEDLARRAARALPGWTMRMEETHHIHKKDAPSGTAITLADAVEQACGQRPAIDSRREGEVIGEHVLRFSGPGETLELRHDAGDRDIFARGALQAAVALAGRQAGGYRLSDLLFDS